jgi:DNA repair protein RecO (recombination protein O)
MVSTEKVIVLHSIKHKDNTRIVKVLTERNKVVSLYVTGFGKGRNKKGAIYYPGNHLEIELNQKRTTDLGKVMDARIISSNSHIHEDIYRASILIFILECLSKYVWTTEGYNGLYDYTNGLLEILGYKETAIANAPMMFLVDLSQFLGVKPESAKGQFNIREGVFVTSAHGGIFMDTKTSEILAQFLSLDRQEILDIKISGERRKHLINQYLKFIDYHVDRHQQILSLDVLSTVLSD